MAEDAPPRKLLHQLPPEIQRRVTNFASERDLATLARTSSHYHKLASEALYASFDQTFPDSSSGHLTRAIDILTAKLDTLVSSPHDYCQYLLQFRLYSARGHVKNSLDNSRPRRSQQNNQDGVYAATRLLNTLLLMMLKRATRLHTFIWNIQQALSPQVLLALQRLRTLRRLHFRLRLARSVADSSSLAFPLPGVIYPIDGMISGNSSEVSSQVTGYTATAAPIMALPSRNPTSPSWKPELLSSFHTLSSLAILDIESTPQIPAIRDMIKNSSPTVKSLTLTLSGRLAARARTRKSNNINDGSAITDPMDFDDGWNAPPVPVIVNPNIGLPPHPVPVANVNPTTIAGAKKEQEQIMGQLFDVDRAQETKLDGELERAHPPALASAKSAVAAIEDVVSETKNLLIETENQEAENGGSASKSELEATLKRLQELKNSMKRLTKEFAKDNPGLIHPPPPAKPPGPVVGSGEPYDGEEYQEWPGPLPTMVNKYGPTTLPGIPPFPPTPGVDVSYGNLSQWPAGVNVAKKHKKPLMTNWSMPLPLPPSFPGDQPGAMLDYQAQLYLLDKQNKSKLKVQNQTSNMNGSAKPLPVPSPLFLGQPVTNPLTPTALDPQPEKSAESEGDGLFDKPKTVVERSRARLEKKKQDMKPEDIDMTHDSGAESAGDEESEEDVAEAESSPTVSKGKGKAKAPELTLNDYVRSTAGIGLEHLAIHLIPLKTSVLIRAINFSTLNSLILLDVGSQKQLWSHLLSKHVHIPLKIEKVSTDHVTSECLTLLSSLPKITELYLYERSASSSKYELSVEPAQIGIRTIRRQVLSKHLPTLKRLYMQTIGSGDRHWDFDNKTVSELVSKGQELEELACTMATAALQTFTQHLSALEKLRVLIFLAVRRVTRHSSTGYPSSQGNSDIINPISNTCALVPEMKLEYLGIHGNLYQLERIDEEGKSSRESFATIYSSSSEPDSSSDDEPLVSPIPTTTTFDIAAPATTSTDGASSAAPVAALNDTLASLSNGSAAAGPAADAATAGSSASSATGQRSNTNSTSKVVGKKKGAGRIRRKAQFIAIDRAVWPRDIKVLRKDVMGAQLLKIGLEGAKHVIVKVNDNLITHVLDQLLYRPPNKMVNVFSCPDQRYGWDSDDPIPRHLMYTFDPPWFNIHNEFFPKLTCHTETPVDFPDVIEAARKMFAKHPGNIADRFYVYLPGGVTLNLASWNSEVEIASLKPTLGKGRPEWRDQVGDETISGHLCE